MSDAQEKPLLPRWRTPAGEYPAAAGIDRIRSIETVIAELVRQLTALPAGHPRGPGLISMIRGLSAEAARRERSKAHRPAPAPASRRVRPLPR